MKCASAGSVCGLRRFISDEVVDAMIRLLALIWLCVVPSLANRVELEVESLGASAFNADIALFDVHVTQLSGAGTRWTWGGAFAETFGGATLAYKSSPGPNEPILTAPDWNNTGDAAVRDVTFVNLPAEPDARRRFNRNGEADIAGRYLGGAGLPIAQPDRLDVAWNDAGFAGRTTGAFARLAIDLTATGFDAEDLVVELTLGALTATDTPLVLGAFNATDDAFTDGFQTPYNFQIFAIPEPAPLAAMLAGVLLFARRRLI